MKKCFLFLFCLSIQLAWSQTDCEPPTATLTTEQNQISAQINNTGSLFMDGDFNRFVVPKDNPDQVSTIFMNGLFLLATDPANNVKLAGAAYGATTGMHDFYAGPFSPTDTDFSDACTQWNKIWSVTGADIRAHIADFEDNGVVDNQIEAIYSWPALDNPFFASLNGFTLPDGISSFAYYFDNNQDGLYNPDDGDYPTIPKPTNNIPSEITYCVYNDRAMEHTETQGNALGAEVHQTTWSYSCEQDEPINKTLFVSYKIVNKSVENWFNTSVGFLTDFDLGCYTDDYVGSAPVQNTYYAYNLDNFDGATTTNDCFWGGVGYQENPPAQGVTFLNRPLSYTSTYEFTANYVTQMWQQMRGNWPDGTPFTIGGTGYNPSGTPTNHLFSDPPSNENGWSMFSENLLGEDTRVLGNTALGVLPPGGQFEVDVAFTFARKEGANHIENVDFLLDEVQKVQNLYNNDFSFNCSPLVGTSVENAQRAGFKIFPNPATDKLSIEANKHGIDAVALLSIDGKILQYHQYSYQQAVELDLSSFSSGMYILKIYTEEQIYSQKIIKTPF